MGRDHLPLPTQFQIHRNFEIFTPADFFRPSLGTSLTKVLKWFGTTTGIQMKYWARHIVKIGFPAENLYVPPTLRRFRQYLRRRNGRMSS